jgi:uncharacterized protein YutE (UPF0331/DUF86 family)
MKPVDVGHHSSLEERVFNRLRPRFEELGYEFTVQPDGGLLPGFLDGYVPDAIATRADDRVVMEIKGSHARDSERILELRRRFEGQTDWRLTVIYGIDDVPHDMIIPMPEIQAVREKSSEVRAMVERGYVPAALVMAFSLLESALHLVSASEERRPKKPGTVVQELAMDGLIDGPVEERLRSLIDLRNRIVHGDLSRDVAARDVVLVLAAVDRAIGAAFAV